MHSARVGPSLRWSIRASRVNSNPGKIRSLIACLYLRIPSRLPKAKIRGNGAVLNVQDAKVAIFDYIETGETLDEFLENFPSVKKKLAIQVLEMASKTFDGT